MLVDGFNRKLDYLRVSVTDKCNLRCVYCMPQGGVRPLLHNEVLRNEEFVRLAGIFADMGIAKVRFTGGEPLLRKGFLDIVSRARAAHPSLIMGLTTNGMLLGQALPGLAGNGVSKLNISLDTIDRTRFRAITGSDRIDDVLDAIDRALEAGRFSVKINAVLFRETLDELDGMLDYFRDRDVTLRFIERMPFNGEPGAEGFTGFGELVRMLEQRGTLERNTSIDTSVAVMYSFLYKGLHRMRVGVIPPMTHKFCGRCNRLRLTCDGLLRVCLHSRKEYDLKTPLRMGLGDDAIRGIIAEAVADKPREHTLECGGEGDGCVSLAARRQMSQIGG
ncbi:MAG: GTP 3',8-cyclase MoaA [Spirochaetes bacterium]|nr:MAG: GTP 3',8-cyclase MoaA [Spirochaetota bacterium]